MRKIAYHVVRTPARAVRYAIRGGKCDRCGKVGSACECWW